MNIEEAPDVRTLIRQVVEAAKTSDGREPLDLARDMLKAIEHEAQTAAALALGVKLRSMAQSLTGEEQQLFRSLLSRAARGSEVLEGASRTALLTVVANAALPSTTGPWLDHHGPLPGVDPAVVARAAAESRERRPGAERRTCGRGWFQSIGEAGTSLIRAIGAAFPAYRPGSNAIYLYYDRLGDGLNLHIDRPEYRVNALVTLDHRTVGERRSDLYFLGSDGKTNPISLAQGEAVIFDASSVFHGRTPVSAGESVTMLSVGLTNA